MRSIICLATLALAGTAVAQDVAQLPTCAQGCLGTSIADSGCKGFDFNCICSDTSLISQLSCCVFKACEPSDQEATLAFGNGICNSAQPPVMLPQSASCPASAGPTPTSAPASSAASSDATATATPTPSSAAPEASSAAPSSEAPAASSSASSSVTAMPASSSSAAPAPAQTTSSVMTGAAPTFGHAGELTGLVGAVIGAAAFFL